MTDRDLEIEISTLRGELATVKAELARAQEINATCDWAKQLVEMEADRDDWRDIAIGLRDFGGPPLPKHQRQFGEVLARYLERLRKEGA